MLTSQEVHCLEAGYHWTELKATAHQEMMCRTIGCTHVPVIGSKFCPFCISEGFTPELTLEEEVGER